MEHIKALRESLENKQAVLGTRQVLKGLRQKKLNVVYMAANCPASTRKTFIHYAKLVDVPLVELKQTNEELGILAKKPFLISAIGVVSHEQNQV